MYIKIDINPEGVGAFRIHFENSLPRDIIEYDLLEGLEDVIVSASYFEQEGVLSSAIEKTVEFLTANAFHLAEDIQVTYIQADEELALDTQSNEFVD